MSDLSRFRIEAEGTPPEPTPPQAVRLPEGVVLAADQSLADFGWVLLCSTGTSVTVRRHGVIRTKPEDYPKGHEGTLRRGTHVFFAFREVVLDLSEQHALDAVVHETPPVGGRMARPESSLLSALAVRLVASHVLPDVSLAMVSNQHSKSVLVGAGNATKGQWHKGLEPYSIDLPNEATRDAACLALTYLIDTQTKEDPRGRTR